jgi:hypothetical protein
MKLLLGCKFTKKIKKITTFREKITESGDFLGN